MPSHVFFQKQWCPRRSKTIFSQNKSPETKIPDPEAKNPASKNSKTKDPDPENPKTKIPDSKIAKAPPPVWEEVKGRTHWISLLEIEATRIFAIGLWFTL